VLRASLIRPSANHVFDETCQGSGDEDVTMLEVSRVRLVALALTASPSSQQQETARDSNKTLQQQETKHDTQGTCLPTPSCAHTRQLAGLRQGSWVAGLMIVVARALSGLSVLSLPSLVLDSHDLLYSLSSHHMPLLAGNQDERFF
jgi:hypothetical protein